MKKLTILFAAVLFCFTSFAQGFYFEMKMSSNKQAMGTMKVFAQDGNSRSEINVTTPMGPMDMVTLSLMSNPTTIYMLDDKKKTYSEIDASKSDQWKDESADDYEITILGKEKANGYNSTHVKVKRKDSKSEQELWLSTELADYSTFLKAKTKFTGRENMHKALEAKGVMGFPVKIIASDHGNEIQIDFVKAEKRSNPSSLFSLDGYSKSAGGGMSSSVQDMIQKMKDMTPEERQKAIDQMKQQYQQQH
jgi:hypothetical protein